MYSWAISGSSNAICDCLFLVFPGVSLTTAANFLLFFKVAMVPREKFCQQCIPNWSIYFCNQQWLSPPIMRENDFNKMQTVIDINFGTIPKGYNLYIKQRNLISPISTFPWRETWLFTHQLTVQIRKSTSIILSIKGECRLWREIVTSFKWILFFFHGSRLFRLSMEKVRVQFVRIGHQSGYSRDDTKWLFPRWHNT